MSQCICYTDAGRVKVLRMNLRMLAALQIPAWTDAWPVMAQLGGAEVDWQRYRATMTAFTEAEAIRALQDCWVPGGKHYEERRTAELILQGVMVASAAAQVASEAAAVSNVTVCEEVGLLHPTEASTRRFRACWRQTGLGPPQVDMPLAHAQRMNEVRTARVPRLAKADADINRARDTGMLPLEASLRTYRQALRDVPQTNQASLAACGTVVALEAWQPTWPTNPA